MKPGTLLSVVGLLGLAAFVILNLQAFTAPAVLSLGWRDIEAPLGLVMLGFIAGLILVFLLATALRQKNHLAELQNTLRELRAQRELADKAEASRFLELRRYLEQQAVQTEQRRSRSTGQETPSGTFETQLQQFQQALCQRLDQTDNSVAAYFGQLEDLLLRNRDVPLAEESSNQHP